MLTDRSAVVGSVNARGRRATPDRGRPVGTNQAGPAHAARLRQAADRTARSGGSGLRTLATTRRAPAKGARTSVLAHYADRIDGLVREIADAAGAQTDDTDRGLRARRLRPPDALPALRHRPAGRLRRRRSARRGARSSTALLQPLWDLRLTVGQHVRELGRLRRRRGRQPRAPAGAARHPAAWPATARCSTALSGEARRPSGAAARRAVASRRCST